MASKVAPEGQPSYAKGNPRDVLAVKTLKQTMFGTNYKDVDQDYFKFRQENCPDKFYELQTNRDGSDLGAAAGVNRCLCYFEYAGGEASVDGCKGPIPMVAFHGGCEGKYKFMQNEPIPGVDIYSVDRPGYGGSCWPGLDYSLQDAVDDMWEFVDNVILSQEKYAHTKKVVLTGHSVGTAWCQQMAATRPESVFGLVLWSTVADPYHRCATASLRGKMNAPTGCFDLKNGCLSCLPRGFMTGTAANHWEKHNFKNWCHDHEVGTQTFEEGYKNDSFWITSTLDSWWSNHEPRAILGDATRIYQQWPVDVNHIQCPVWIFHGDKDHDVAFPETPDAVQDMVELPPPKRAHGFKRKTGQVIINKLESCGHVCSVGPTAATRKRFMDAIAAFAVAMGKSYDRRFGSEEQDKVHEQRKENIAIDDVISRIWDKFDENRNGTLEKGEAKKFVKQTMGKKLEKAAANKVVNQTMGNVGGAYHEEAFEEIWKQLDKDGSGSVEKPEIRQLVKSMLNNPRPPM